MLRAEGQVLVLTTVASLEQAAELSEALLSNRLAACVTVLPGALSNYRWKGEAFLSEPEQILLIKTFREKLAAIEEFFKEHHPYECPEILAFDAMEVGEKYADWMKEQL